MQSNPTPAADKITETTVKKLQDCMRGELAATETYELALTKVQHVGLHRALQNIFSSHAGRVSRLRRRILELGGDVPSTSGVWGTFATLAQKGADLVGDKAAIGMLEEGEDRQLKIYDDAVESVDSTTRQLIQRDLIEEQRRTHALCRELKEYTRAPS